MLLSYKELTKLVEHNVITNVSSQLINGASIDVTLGRYLQVEKSNVYVRNLVNLKNKGIIGTREIDLLLDCFYLHPGNFVLAQTEQVFNLPYDIAAEYKLKSSLARCGLNHALAGWCDPGWHGSVLTLELHNITQSHVLTLEQGMKIGQVIFYRVEPVAHDVSYAARGQYNEDTKATASKGVR
ncbi:MAG: dCTP deaminase [Rhodobacter sp.]|nr:dCTP deaminase [Rhodobacter sp.]